MKILCDVCDRDEASVFCVADEAALCAACDQRVHHANKLAGKHQRFSLHHPSPKQAPLCDICQERRAFLFCRQDRAILCSECDLSIHKANEQTQKHTRFLLTGLELSVTSALCSPSPSSAETASSTLSNNASGAVKNNKTQVSKDKPLLVSSNYNKPSTQMVTKVESFDVAPPESCEKSNTRNMSAANLINSSVAASSISEYLIEMLPGWRVEDLLDSSFPSYGFCKTGDNDALPSWDADLESNMSAEKMGFWVPRVPPPLNLTQNQSYQPKELASGASNANKEQSKEFTANNIKSSRKWSEESSFVVPQISPPFSASKRIRTLW